MLNKVIRKHKKKSELKKNKLPKLNTNAKLPKTKKVN